MEENTKNIDKPNIFLRILRFPLIQIFIAIILVNIPTFILRSLTQFILSSLSIDNITISAFMIFCVRLLTVYFAYYFFVKFFEKRKANEISISFTSVKELSTGILFGFLSISIIMTLIWITGNFKIIGINNNVSLFQSFLYNFFFAFLQDIVYFAIIFRIIENRWGSWSAIVIASIIFGFKHLLFPGYTLWSVIAQSFEAGILFSTLFIFTRRIWIIFGFHFAWNFIQYGLFLGIESEKLRALFQSEFSGSNLITGMPVGPEASVFTFCILTSIGIYLLIKAYRKNKFIPPNWKRRERTVLY